MVGESKPSTRGSVTDDPARVLHVTFGLVGCLGGQLSEPGPRMGGFSHAHRDVTQLRN